MWGLVTSPASRDLTHNEPPVRKKLRHTHTHTQNNTKLIVSLCKEGILTLIKMSMAMYNSAQSILFLL